MDTTFCIDALEKALDVSTPEIFNTDQGAQFTSPIDGRVSDNARSKNTGRNYAVYTRKS
jgi:hypothetical protein